MNSVTIHIPRHHEIVLPNPDLIRLASTELPGLGKPDLLDCVDYTNDVFRLQSNPTVLAHRRAGTLKVCDPSMIAQYVPSFWGSTSTPAQPSMRNSSTASSTPPYAAQPGYIWTRDAAGSWVMVPDPRGQAQGSCPTTPRDGGTPQSKCVRPVSCGNVPLGFNTFNQTGYPVTGAVVGELTVGDPFEVTAGRANWYEPMYLFFSGRNSAAGMAPMEAFLISATVNRNSQLAGDGDDTAIGSDTFQGVGPLRIDDWNGFGNVNPNTLLLEFGNANGPGVDMQVAGVFFGVASFDGPSGSQ